MTAGADEYIGRLMRKLQDFDGYNGPLQATIRHVEASYRQCVEEAQDVRVFLQNGLTRQQYVDAISRNVSNTILEKINDELAKLAKNFDCEILICGLDDIQKPYILHIGPPGLAIDYTETGFGAIGQGAFSAASRLLFVDHKRSDKPVNVLFDCFDAKAVAEMTPSVGTSWDAYFVTSDRVEPLIEAGRDLIDRIWAKRNRSPFKPRDKDAMRNPPKDWQRKLNQYVADSLGIPFLWSDKKNFLAIKK